MLLHNMPNFPLYELSCLMFFLIPMVFIVVLYVRMCLRIQRNTLGRSIEGSVHGETRQAHSRKAIVRMLSKLEIHNSRLIQFIEILRWILLVHCLACSMIHSRSQYIKYRGKRRVIWERELIPLSNFIAHVFN